MGTRRGTWRRVGDLAPRDRRNDDGRVGEQHGTTKPISPIATKTPANRTVSVEAGGTR